VQAVAECFDTQRSGNDPAIAHDNGKSPNLIHNRIGWLRRSSRAYGQDRDYPSVPLLMHWSKQQDQWHIQKVVSSHLFSFRNTPNIC
jgi:hypothetical protein